jgi:magnesium-transporting ATPase (P-type)
MNTKIAKNIFYSVALGYVFLGVFFIDWSFRMVPFDKNASRYDTFMAIIINAYFIILGIMLYVATFLAVRKKRAASILYNLSFWIGATVLGIITILSIILVMFGRVSSAHIGDVIMYCLLYAPFMLVYLNRKRLA